MTMSKRTRRSFAVLANSLRPLANIMMGKEWLGLEKLPRDRGFIVCPNHCTEIDPVVVGHMLYNQDIMPHFLAKAGLFKTPFFGPALRGANQIPVERAGAGAGRSLQVAREVLDEGGAIIIYPEGTLTRDPDLWPMKGHTGAARLALKTGAPVIPVAHWGAQEVFPRYAKRVHLFPRKRVRVLVGDPVDLSRFEGAILNRETLQAATDVILDDVTALLVQLRGGQPPAERWDPAAHNQSTHGRFTGGGAQPQQAGSDDDGPTLGAETDATLGAESDATRGAAKEQDIPTPRGTE
ncbi:MAG: 1-acyl-sn-glycerol-3-phosphate acyltransferase [Actinomycetota bacterium]|nr:1-acyl-sn-glycerol-3-phosphate acyltransferase [Actinomycetota bacterium]